MNGQIRGNIEFVLFFERNFCDFADGRLPEKPRYYACNLDMLKIKEDIMRFLHDLPDTEVLKFSDIRESDNISTSLVDRFIDVRLFGAANIHKRNLIGIQAPIKFTNNQVVNIFDKNNQLKILEGNVAIPDEMVKNFYNDAFEGVTDPDEIDSVLNTGKQEAIMKVDHGLFSITGLLDAKLAEKATLTRDDYNNFLTALWNAVSMPRRDFDSFSNPLFHLQIEYTNKNVVIGQIETLIELNISTEREISINLTGLTERILDLEDQVDQVKIWSANTVDLQGLNSLKNNQSITVSFLSI